MSLRIAAHQSRRGFSAAKPASFDQLRPNSGSRAAQAAARVAARYAQAPSYRHLLAAETCAGPRAAGIAARAQAADLAAPRPAPMDADLAVPQAALAAVAAPVAPQATRQDADLAARQSTFATVAAPASSRIPQTEPTRAFAPVLLRAWNRESGAAPAQPAEPRFLAAALPVSLDAWESESSHTRWKPDLRLLPLTPAPHAPEKLDPEEGGGFNLRVRPTESTWASAPAFHAAEKLKSKTAKLESRPALYQGTTSVVPQIPQNSGRALAPEGCISPISPEAPTLFPALSAPRPDRAIAPLLADDPQGPTLVEELWDGESLEPVESPLPIPGNLIEFPREVVATRKRRPRRAEGPFAPEAVERQLTIFEVNPGVESTGGASAQPWPEPDWSGIALEAQSPAEPEPQETPAPPLAPELASIGRRLIAVLVDSLPIAAIGFGSALAVAATSGHAPAPRILGLSAAAALLIAGMTYQTLFLTLAGTTPGMRCAHLSLCTFDGQIPTLAQIRSRLGALLLSVVPVGLGIAWALFDEDHLCWHDRLSRTYLRMG